MLDDIELTFESDNGIVDCRVELQDGEDTQYFAATILYPEIINGFSRSEIYCHDLCWDERLRRYFLVDGGDGIASKIQQLEDGISNGIIQAQKTQ